MTRSRVLLALIFLSAPGVILAPAWRLAGMGAGEDELLYYLPLRIIFADAVRAGYMPQIDPWTGCGRPVLADPQFAAWYPGTWLFAALPVVPAHGLSLWLHYSLAMWGAYRLFRVDAAATRAGAVFGALVFAFGGAMLAHRSHLAMQNSAAWIPWVFWAVARLVQTSGSIRSAPTARRCCIAVLLASLLCFAGHTQIAALTALGSLVWIIARGGRIRSALRWLSVWILTAGVFAIQWLPSLLYARICTRSERGFMGFVENSLTPPSLISFFFPDFLGQRVPGPSDSPYWGPWQQAEQFCYAGILPLLLMVVVLRAARGRALRSGWLLLLIFALLLALGLYGPIAPPLYFVPGSSLFRVPARALFLLHLALGGLGSIGVSGLSLVAERESVRIRAAAREFGARARGFAVLLAVWLGFAAFLALLLPAFVAPGRVAAEVTQPRLWWHVLAYALAILVCAAAIRWVARNWRRPQTAGLFALLLALDLARIGWKLDVPHGPTSSAGFLATKQRHEWLPHLNEPGRLWVVTLREGDVPGEYIAPLEKLVANTNVFVHQPNLIHYGPLQPRLFVQRFGFAPWGEADRAAELLQDSEWMRDFNVRWVLLCNRALPAPTGGELITTTSTNWRLYRIPFAGGLARSAAGGVRVIQHDPAHLEIYAPPGPVHVSLLALPGWTAKTLWSTRTIEAPAGLITFDHPSAGGPVVLRYRTPGLLPGACISAATLALLAAYALLAHRKVA